MRVNQLAEIVSIYAGGNSSWAVRDADTFQARQSILAQEFEEKRAKRKGELENIILNSSQSPIRHTDGDDKDADLLFMEDEAKYDSLLRKSSFLDSPAIEQPQTAAVADTGRFAAN